MSSDADLVQLSRDQQAEIMAELGRVAKDIDSLREIASLASKDAREIAGLISPEARSLINWYKAFILLGSACLTLVGSAAVLWLNANFVSLRSNDEAWGKQVEININNLKQFQSLEVATRVNDTADSEQNRRIDQMESDLKELRRVLKK